MCRLSCMDIASIPLDITTESNSLSVDQEKLEAFGSCCIIIDKILEQEDNVEPSIGVTVNDDFTISVSLECTNAEVTTGSLLYCIMVIASDCKFSAIDGESDVLELTLTFPGIWN